MWLSGSFHLFFIDLTPKLTFLYIFYKSYQINKIDIIKYLFISLNLSILVNFYFKKSDKYTHPRAGQGRAYLREEIHRTGSKTL